MSTFVLLVYVDQKIDLKTQKPIGLYQMKIEYEHPVTGEKCEFDCPEAKYIDGYRTHHPVIVSKNGLIDQEDWFYRFLDQYDGPIVARYSRTCKEIWEEMEVPTISHVILLSFEDWKKNNVRICGYAKLPSYTIRSMIRDLGLNDPENVTWRKNIEPEEKPQEQIDVELWRKNEQEWEIDIELWQKECEEKEMAAWAKEQQEKLERERTRWLTAR